ncbi:MAG TPA: ferritin-like domain-containing protein [Acidobacteriaceae bacterium]
MASNDVEVLDPAATVEKLKEFVSERVLNRRNFIAALGVAGAAAGTGLVSTPSAVAQQPVNPGGYSQVDVLNLMLNIKYLKATLYSYLTQGTDLPAASGVTTGTGVVLNAPAKLTFSTQQITDLFNEMYYDELNQLISLRSLQGTAVAGRQSVNLLGTGLLPAPVSLPTLVTLTQSQAIALARMLEDLSAQAFATASIYLTGNNLAFANQALAVDGFHAGAIRLIAIQTGAQYQGTQYSELSSTTTATVTTFNGSTTSGSGVINAYFAAAVSGVGNNVPAVGNMVSGVGIPAGATITAMTGGMPFGATTAAGSALVTNVSSVTGLAAANGASPGTTIVGPGIPTGTTIVTLVSTAPFSITLSNAATASATVTLSGMVNLTGITAITTSGSPTLTGLNKVDGLAVGQIVTGAGIPANTTITAVQNTAPFTVTLSAKASATVTTAVAIVAGAGTVTLSQNATVTGVNTMSIPVADNFDVAPADIGAGAANGPAAIAGTSPTMYQGFFDTAGSATSNGNNPPGFLFVRTFQQILAVLYNYNGSTSVDSVQNVNGGFYPYGVSGQITSVT